MVKADQGTNSLQIHRLVHAVMRSQMSDQEQVEARHEVHKILAGARPRQGKTDDRSNWSTHDVIWPHLHPSQAEVRDDLRTRQLLIDWVRYQWTHCEFESGLNLVRRLENLKRPVQSPQQCRGRLGRIHARQVHGGMVGERLYDPDLADPDRGTS